MIVLALGAIVACLVGTALLLVYRLGHSHGAAEARSVEWERVQRAQRRHKRCTPEPVRLRLLELPDPFHEITDDMPEFTRRNFEAINEGIAEGMRRHPVFFDQDGPGVA